MNYGLTKRTPDYYGREFARIDKAQAAVSRVVQSVDSDSSVVLQRLSCS